MLGITAFGLLLAAAATCYLIAEAIHWCHKPEPDDDTLGAHYEAAKNLIRERNTDIEFARITDELGDLRGVGRQILEATE